MERSEVQRNRTRSEIARFVRRPFRPSKKPPIGFRWLDWKINDWADRLVVPPHLNLKPKGLKGYWYPKGKMREYLLRSVRAINKQHRIKFGCNAAGWSTLLASVVSQQEEWEFLVYGPEEKDIEEYQSLGSSEEIRDRCGGVSPCRECYAGEELDGSLFTHQREIVEFYNESFTAWFTSDAECGVDLDQYIREKGQCNPFCQRRCTQEVKDAFA
jgi:hypothetical protein